MKTVVVTGGDGFIGHHLVQYFAKKGLCVYALTIPKSPMVDRIQNIPNVMVLQRDLSDSERLVKELPNRPEAFIHLAWSGVSPKNRDSIDLQINNIALCLQAVRLAAQIRTKRFILPGSSMEYMYCGQEINEQACPSPQNAYSAAKISARYLCESLCADLKLPYIYTVITGIYAADRTDNNVIYYTISELLKGKKPLLTALEQKWDYVYIDDVVHALYLIVMKGKDGSFYSIGHGDNWPLYNYIYQIRDIIDPSLPLGIGEIPYKYKRLPSSCIDMTSLKRDTGFVPQVPFDVGIKEVIEQIKQKSDYPFHSA